MKPAIAASLLAFAALLPSPGVAQDLNGRVHGVYFQAAPGVLVDASMLHAPSARRWADVQPEGPQPLARRRELVELPPGTRAAPGDTVVYRPGQAKSTELAEVLPAIAANRALSVSPEAPQFAESASTGASKVRGR